MTQGREYSDDTAKMIDSEIFRILHEQEARAHRGAARSTAGHSNWWPRHCSSERRSTAPKSPARAARASVRLPPTEAVLSDRRRPRTAPTSTSTQLDLSDRRSGSGLDPGSSRLGDCGPQVRRRHRADEARSDHALRVGDHHDRHRLDVVLAVQRCGRAEYSTSTTATSGEASTLALRTTSAHDVARRRREHRHEPWRARRRRSRRDRAGQGPTKHRLRRGVHIADGGAATQPTPTATTTTAAAISTCVMSSGTRQPGSASEPERPRRSGLAGQQPLDDDPLRRLDDQRMTERCGIGDRDRDHPAGRQGDGLQPGTATSPPGPSAFTVTVASANVDVQHDEHVVDRQVGADRHAPATSTANDGGEPDDHRRREPCRPRCG